MEYWTIIDDRHAGPFTADELIGMGIKPDSPVWFSGLPDWVEASKIEELRIALEQRDSAMATQQIAQPEATHDVVSPEQQSVGSTSELDSMVDESAFTQASGFQQQPQPQQPQPQQLQEQQPQEQYYAQNQYPYQDAPAPAPEPKWDWQREPMAVNEPCPPAYLAWSIIVTLLCCQLLGIVAIICSAQTKQAYNRGNIEKAKKMSDWAQWLIILSIVFGLLSLPFQILMMGL